MKASNVKGAMVVVQFEHGYPVAPAVLFVPDSLPNGCDGVVRKAALNHLESKPHKQFPYLWVPRMEGNTRLAHFLVTISSLHGQPSIRLASYPV